MLDAGGQRFEQHRRVLLALAYRMLGAIQDAEDVVQDAWMRWQDVHEPVQNDRAYLCRIVTRLCLDRAKSAAAQREQYPGPWLPDFVDTETLMPEEHAERAESLGMAFLVLLQSLSPNERAAFLLRQIFDFDYADIAAVLDATEAACRQWVSRAQAALAQRKPRYQPDPAEVQRVAGAFMRACAIGDVQQVLACLAPDARSFSDSGGKFPGAARNIIDGAASVAALFVALAQRVPSGAAFDVKNLNGQPAIVIRSGSTPLDVIWLEIADGRVRDLYALLNPDRLQRFA